MLTYNEAWLTRRLTHIRYGVLGIPDNAKRTRLALMFGAGVLQVEIFMVSVLILGLLKSLLVMLLIWCVPYIYIIYVLATAGEKKFTEKQLDWWTGKSKWWKM